MWTTRHVRWIVRFVDDLGAAGRVALRRDVLEGERAVSPLFLNVAHVGSILARRLPLNQSVNLACPLLVQVLAVLLSEACTSVLLLETTRAAAFLVEASLLSHRELQQARLIRQTLVLREVVELRQGLLLGLVEFVVELAGVHGLAGCVVVAQVGDQMALSWLHA